MLEVSHSPEGQAAVYSAAPQKPLWRNRTFACVFSSHCVSLLGNAFHSIALNLWVLQTTGSARLMSVVLIANLIVQLLLGAMAGTVADRMDRRMLMYWSDISRCVLVAGIAVTMFIPGTPFVLILLLTTLTTAAGLFYSPAFQASLIHLVAREQIQQASAALIIADNVIRISGFALGGIAVAVFGGVFAVAIDAATFLISAILLYAGGRFPGLPPAQPREKSSFKEELFVGLKFIWSEPLVRAALWLLPPLFTFFLSSLMLTQVMAVRVWQASPFVFGLIEACIPLGYVLGSGLIMALGSRLKHRGAWILLSVLLLGPVYILLSRTDSGSIALPFILAAGFIFSFSTLIIHNMLRLETDPSVQGRVFGTLGSLSSIAPPIGLACFSMLSDRYSPSLSLLICGIGMLALGIFALLKLKSIRLYK